MYLSELVLIISLLVLLATQNRTTIDRRISSIPLVFSLGVFFAILALDQLRWQMLPACLLLIILVLLDFKKTSSHVVLKSTGITLGLLLLVGTVVLSLALPVISLPVPEGPYTVGTRYISLVDESRNESYFGLPDEAREVSLRVWYPGVLPESQPPPQVRTLWQDLYQGPIDRIAFLSGYMRGIKTHSYPDIPLALSDTPYPVLIFSHGQGLFAEQNTLLMEHMASHGYVVFGVNHARMSMRMLARQEEIIRINPQRQQQALAEGDKLDDETLTRLFTSSGNPDDLSTKLAALAPELTRQLKIRIADLRFVMGSIVKTSPESPEMGELWSYLDSERIGLVGMSFGGTTVLQTCKVEMRCRAVLNLDGPLLGDQRWETLSVPVLSMLSSWAQPYYTSVLLDSRGPYYEVLVHGAEHDDFFDMTLLMARWLSGGEGIASQRAIQVVNAVALKFFDAYLRDASLPRIDIEIFPELEISMNAQAREQIAL